MVSLALVILTFGIFAAATPPSSSRPAREAPIHVPTEACDDDKVLVGVFCKKPPADPDEYYLSCRRQNAQGQILFAATATSVDGRCPNGRKCRKYDTTRGRGLSNPRSVKQRVRQMPTAAIVCIAADSSDDDDDSTDQGGSSASGGFDSDLADRSKRLQRDASGRYTNPYRHPWQSYRDSHG